MVICRVCDAVDFDQIIDLGNQPWGNGFLTRDQITIEEFYPLILIRCRACSTAQLSVTVPKETMFSNHTYLSGTTKSLSNHFNEIAKTVNRKFGNEIKSPRILDIGSNDGTLLSHFREMGYEILGVESSEWIASYANNNGIPTLHAFFNEETADEISEDFNFIHASGVFFHLEELHSVTKAVKALLKEDGVFVVQFIYMKTMQDNTAFDQIYHEHLLYYTLRSLQVLLDRHGLELFDAEFSEIHGGSIIGFVGHKGCRAKTNALLQLIEEEECANSNSLEKYLEFASRISGIKEKTNNWIDSQIIRGKVVYGLGAPVKGNTLLNYFNLGPDKIPFLVERNALRKDLLSPGMHIPVVLENDLPTIPDAYLVLAWNYKREILERHQIDVENGVEFFFPIDPGVKS